jgi:hypothetical protein
MNGNLYRESTMATKSNIQAATSSKRKGADKSPQRRPVGRPGNLTPSLAIAIRLLHDEGRGIGKRRLANYLKLGGWHRFGRTCVHYLIPKRNLRLLNPFRVAWVGLPNERADQEFRTIALGF